MRRRLFRAKAITALALAVAALSLAVPAVRHADAALQTQQSCGTTGSKSLTDPTMTTAVAVGTQFECDFVITAAIGALTVSPTSPATLRIDITAPPNTFFFGPGVAGTLPNGCTAAAPPPPPAPPQMFVVISCPPAPSGGGLPVGTVIPLQLISGYPFVNPAIVGVAGLITMMATLTPAPPTLPLPPVTGITFVYQFDAFPGPMAPPPPPNATISGSTGTAAPNGVTCTNTTPGARLGSTTSFQIGDTFSCAITYPANQTQSFVVIAGNGIANVNQGPQQSSRPAPNNIGFPCGTVSPAAACTTVTLTGIMGGTGTPSFTVRSFALGAAQPYNTATVTPSGVTIVPPPGGGGGGGGAPTLAGVIGCANSTQASDIAFPAAVSGTPPTGALVGTTQFASRPPLSGLASAPGVLSVLNPGVAVICGAIFQDSGAAPADTDANPNTIDGGTITYTLNSPIAVIVESGTATYPVNCGNGTPGSGLNTCKSAVFTPAFGPTQTPPEQASPASPAFLSPPEPNTVHVALAPGASFPFIGALSPAVGISATFTRFSTLGPAVTLTTNTATIALASPPYQMQLAANPGTVAAASGVDNGSTVVATILHPLVTGCVTLTVGSFLVCPSAPTLFLQGTSPGAEGGQVTFSTDAGALGPANASSGSQLALRYTVHCGPIPSSPPVVLVPDVPSLNPAPASFVFASCTAAQVTLYGAGAPGTATVTASFIGDITGVTAQATVQVTLAAAGAAANLSPGCNQVITSSSLTAGSPLSTIVNVVQPGGIVVSIWQFNNATHKFQAGYFSVSGAPVDFSTVGPTQSLFVCVNSNGAYQPGTPSPGSGPTGP